MRRMLARSPLDRGGLVHVGRDRLQAAQDHHHHERNTASRCREAGDEGAEHPSNHATGSPRNLDRLLMAPNCLEKAFQIRA